MASFLAVNNTCIDLSLSNFREINKEEKGCNYLIYVKSHSIKKKSLRSDTDWHTLHQNGNAASILGIVPCNPHGRWSFMSQKKRNIICLWVIKKGKKKVSLSSEFHRLLKQCILFWFVFFAEFSKLSEGNIIMTSYGNIQGRSIQDTWLISFWVNSGIVK